MEDVRGDLGDLGDVYFYSEQKCLRHDQID